MEQDTTAPSTEKEVTPVQDKSASSRKPQSEAELLKKYNKLKRRYKSLRSEYATVLD